MAPSELEAILLTHPAISDAAVIPHSDPDAGEVPKAFLVTKGAVNDDEVLAFVAARVAPFKRLRSVEFIEQLPRSATGKLLRRVLRDRDLAKTRLGDPPLQTH